MTTKKMCLTSAEVGQFETGRQSNKAVGAENDSRLAEQS